MSTIILILILVIISVIVIIVIIIKMAPSSMLCQHQTKKNKHHHLLLFKERPRIICLIDLQLATVFLCFAPFYWLPRSRIVSLRSLRRYLSSSVPYRLAAHGRRTGLLGCCLPSAWRQRGAANGGDQGECSKQNGGPKDSEDVKCEEDVTWPFWVGTGMTDTKRTIPWWGFKQQHMVYYTQI